MSDASSDLGIPAPLDSESAQALRRLREDILIDWEKRVRAGIKAASGLPHPIIINTIPSFLDNLAEALSDSHPRATATESTNIGYEHGGERARMTRYGPEQLISEYGLLREAMMNHLESAVPLSKRDQSTIQKSFDQTIHEAVAAYFLVYSRIREQFVAGLSHDLRTPLTAARMAAELISSNAKKMPEGEARETLSSLSQRIVKSMVRADRMIQDLLDASVLQVGERIPLRVQSECEMLSVVRNAVAGLPAADQSRVSISGEPVFGYWDGDTFGRAIENLISNAVKYGSPDAPIQTKVTALHDRVMIHVHNEGNHIPAEEQALLFQPFHRSRAARAGTKRGWGIGLALVRGIAEGHGGSLGVDSSPERGTTFLIDVPRDARPFVHPENI